MGRIFMFNHVNINTEEPVDFNKTNQIVIKAFGIMAFGIGPRQESFYGGERKDTITFFMHGGCNLWVRKGV